MNAFIIHKYRYLLAGALLLLAARTLPAQTPNPPTSFTVTAQSPTSIDLSWQAPASGTTPDFYLVVARKGGGTYPVVVDGVAVADDFDFSLPDENGAVNVAHTAGLNTYTWTGLDPETFYEFTVYAYTTSGGTPPNYRNTGAPSGSDRTFSVEPGAHSTTFTATAISYEQIDLAFDAASTIADADGYIILRRAGTAPDATGVTDGSSPGSLSLPGGTTLVTTITSSSDTDYSDTGLSGSTDYHYILIPYNYNGAHNSTYNYKTDGTIPAANATTPVAPPVISSVSPTGSTCVGETITINGSNFNSPTVTINGVTATISGVSNSTQIEITAPGGAAVGTYPIVVTNADLMFGSSSNYTIKEAINTSVNVAPDKTNVATNENFYIEVGGGTQATVTYRVRRISPTTSGYSFSQTGNGGILTFGPYDHGTPGSYVYEVQAQSSNCASATLTQTATVTIAALSADAGPATADVCDGDGILLGGSPAVTGGSGFYQITWTSSPPGFTSTETNPLVTPSVNTTYTLSVEDSDGNTDTDMITITVKERTDPADLDIIFNPSSTAYSVEDNPVNLSFTVTGGTTGTGTFSGDGVNSTTNKFHPGAANVGTNDINLLFINSGGCETSVTETVNVYNPSGFISGLDPLYCPYGSDNLTVNVPPPYLSFVNIYLLSPSLVNIPDGSSWTKNLVTRAVTINLDQLPIGRNYFRIVYTITGIIGYNYVPYFDASCLCIKYTIVPIYGPVQTNVYVPLNIKAQPTAKITIRAKTDEFCSNDSPVEVEGSPIGGIWQGSGTTATTGNDSNPAYAPGDNGLADFDPGAAAIGANQVRYIYEDSDGCRDTTAITLTVYDIPTVNFTAPNGCVGIPVEFDPSVTIPGTVTVSAYLWDFNDDKREISATLSDPTYHTYTSSNDYDVTFSALTSDGCVASVTKSIAIGDIPDIKLSWRNVCDGDPSRFAIQSSFFSTNPPDVNTITWDFGDGNVVTANSPPLADTVRFNNYAATGYYTGIATIESDLGCSRSDTVQVYKVYRTGVIDAANEYFEDFNKITFEDQGWKTGGANTSWEWGLPAGALISDDSPGGGSAWVTGLAGSFNFNEKSWVHSPCFDLSALQRPLLSFDLRSLTRPGIDGVVLQMNTANTTNNDADWKTVGSVGEGINWFNATGIFSNPGNQSLLQTGWSGRPDTALWRTATIALDNELAGLTAPQLSRVRFRLAFGSPADQAAAGSTEGFAFDNFKIGQRDRIILVENFTNSGGEGSGPNKTSNQSINTFATAQSAEVVKLEYHLSISGPNQDPVYLDNPVDANARAAYYGITATPFIMLDGETAGTAANVSSMFSTQTLKTAGATIDTIMTTDTPAEKLNIEVTFTAKDDLPPNTVLHIAVIERTIDDPAAMGTNTEASFTHVMKKMLPNALGTRFPAGIPAAGSHTVNVSWSPKAYNLDSLAIIAFLQNEQTREIYQSRILKDPMHIPSQDVITGTEPTFADRIRIYPSPAHEEISVRLPYAATEPWPVRLIDSFGREVYSGTFEPGVSAKTIRTIDWAGGMYILQLEKRTGIMARRKIMVIHR